MAVRCGGQAHTCPGQQYASGQNGSFRRARKRQPSAMVWLPKHRASFVGSAPSKVCPCPPNRESRGGHNRYDSLQVQQRMPSIGSSSPLLFLRWWSPAPRETGLTTSRLTEDPTSRTQDIWCESSACHCWTCWPCLPRTEDPHNDCEALDGLTMHLQGNAPLTRFQVCQAGPTGVGSSSDADHARQ